MFNAAWGIVFLLANFSLFLVCYRLFGVKGLYAWVGIATLLANIQVVKTIEMLGIVMTLGNTIYATIYMTTDLLNEKFGTKAARQAVYIGFFSLIASTIILQLALAFQPQAEDIAQESMETLFGLMPRLAAGSLTAYFVSQMLDVRLFARLRKRFSRPDHFWIRINGSTLTSQLVDSLVFCAIAFAGVYSLQVWLEILLTTYLFKSLVSVVGTPVLYIARRFRKAVLDA